MKFFFKSRNLNEIWEAYETGLINAIDLDLNIDLTKNNELKAQSKEFLRHFDIPLMLGVYEINFDNIVNTIKKSGLPIEKTIYEIPIGINSVKASQLLISQGFQICLGNITSVTQAIIAVKSQIPCISIDLNLIGSNQYIELIETINETMFNYEYNIDIHVKGIINIPEVESVARKSVSSISLMPQLFWKLFKNPAHSSKHNTL